MGEAIRSGIPTLTMIDVLINAKDRPAELARVIESLENQTLRPHRVVIRDESKTPLLHDPRVYAAKCALADLGISCEYEHQVNSSGYGSCRFHILKKRKHPYTLVLDHDFILEPEGIERLMRDALTYPASFHTPISGDIYENYSLGKRKYVAKKVYQEVVACLLTKSEYIDRVKPFEFIEQNHQRFEYSLESVDRILTSRLVEFFGYGRVVPVACMHLIHTKSTEEKTKQINSTLSNILMERVHSYQLSGLLRHIIYGDQEDLCSDFSDVAELDTLSRSLDTLIRKPTRSLAFLLENRTILREKVINFLDHLDGASRILYLKELLGVSDPQLAFIALEKASSLRMQVDTVISPQHYRDDHYISALFGIKKVEDWQSSLDNDEFVMLWEESREKIHTPQKATPYFRHRLSHPDWQVRNISALMLGYLQDADAADLLLDHLDDPVYEVSLDCQEALTKLYHPTLASKVLHKLHNKSWIVKKHALNIMRAYKMKLPTAIVFSLLGDCLLVEESLLELLLDNYDKDYKPIVEHMLERRDNLQSYGLLLASYLPDFDLSRSFRESPPKDRYLLLYGLHRRGIFNKEITELALKDEDQTLRFLAKKCFNNLSTTMAVGQKE